MQDSRLFQTASSALWRIVSLTYRIASIERNQVCELIALNCAIAGERLVSAVDSAIFFFRFGICLESTSAQQIQAKPSVPNPPQSRWRPGAKQTSDPIALPNEEALLSAPPFVRAIS